MPPEPFVDERARAADEAKARIRAAAAEDRWNDALKELNELESLHRDAAAREAIGLDALSKEVVTGRDRYFRERIAPKVFETMDTLTASNSGERSLAAARQWQNREMYVALWEKTATDLGLSKDEIERYWKSRRVVEPRTASYGAGSFVVVRKTAPQPDGPQRPVSAKPMTDEDWWSAADASSRGAWLTANFAETSGFFEVLRANQTECADCGGRGVGDGAAKAVCASCGGCGVVRSVTYR